MLDLRHSRNFLCVLRSLRQTAVTPRRRPPSPKDAPHRPPQPIAPPPPIEMDPPLEQELLNVLAVAGSQLVHDYYIKNYEKSPFFTFEQDRGAGEASVLRALNSYPDARFLTFYACQKHLL